MSAAERDLILLQDFDLAVHILTVHFLLLLHDILWRVEMISQVLRTRLVRLTLHVRKGGSSAGVIGRFTIRRRLL